MSALVWDDTGNKKFETGTKNGVLFVADPTQPNGYAAGVAWNGLTAVTESNSGAEETALWADDIKYASLRSAEEFGATIEAYQCPPEFYQCDGSASIADGVTINQQGRKSFAFSYVTTIGNDVSGTDYGYKIHIIYGATASPSERAYQTINDSPDAITLSWEITTTPVNVKNHKPTAHLIIDSTLVDPTKLNAFKEVLYGSSSSSSAIMLPDAIAQMFE